MKTYYHIEAGSLYSLHTTRFAHPTDARAHAWHAVCDFAKKLNNETGAYIHVTRYEAERRVDKKTFARGHEAWARALAA